MTVETPIEGIWSLDETQPTTTDSRREGDDHLRLIKDAIRKTFASIDAVIDCTDEELNILAGALITTAELNYLDGVTSNIQTQIDDPTIMHTDENNTTTGFFRIDDNFLFINRDVVSNGQIYASLRNLANVPKALLYVYHSSDATRPDAFAILNASNVPKFIFRQDALSLELTNAAALLNGNALALQSAVTALDTASAKNSDFYDTEINATSGSGVFDQVVNTGFGNNDFVWGISAIRRTDGLADTITLAAIDAERFVLSNTGAVTSLGATPSTGQIRVYFGHASGGNVGFRVKVWARKNI